MPIQWPPSSRLQPPYDFPAGAVLIPALKVGALTGTTGLIIGSISAVLRSSTTPTLFALASSTQWFLLGSTFTLTRSTVLHLWTPPLDAPPTALERFYGQPYPTPTDNLHASTLAGGITGGVIGALIRGRRNVIPGTIMFAIFGYVGQGAYNWADARHSERVAIAAEEEAVHPQGKKKKVGFWERVAEMKWSPMRTLSDKEYADMLREKMLAVDAQIALVDEEVERLGKEEQMMVKAGSEGGSVKEEVKK